MEKILINMTLPQACVDHFSQEYELTMPSAEKERFSKEELLKMLPDYDGYFNVRGLLGQELMDAGKKLKAVGNLGVGYDNVEVDYATKRGLPVINTPTTVTEATAEVAIGLIISTMRGFTLFTRELHATKKAGLPPFRDSGVGIQGKTLGIIGFGRIGQSVAKKALALGMKIVYYKPTPAPKEVEEQLCASYLPLDDLLRQSDCVSLNLPYFPHTYHMIGEREFSLMKNTAYLVNTARGQIVDEAALVQALRQGEIRGAGLDVFEFEPDVHPQLFEMDNVTLLPHIGTLALDVRTRMALEALEGIVAVLKGQKPYNTVNPSVYEQ